MAVRVAQGGRVELDELEVGERGAGRVREQQPVAGRAARIRRPRPERRVAAGREDDRRRRGASRATSTRSPSTSRIRGCSRARAVRTSAMWRPVSAPPAWTTRAREWPPSQREPVVEPDAEARAARRCAPEPRRSAARRRSAGRCPRPAASVSAAWSAGSSSVADRGGDAALGRVAVRARVRGLREHEDRGAGVGCREGGGEAGDAGSDDGDVGLVAFLPHKR